MCSAIVLRLSSVLPGLLIVALGGCAPDFPAPPAPDTDPTGVWGRRLAQVVSADGEVDYTALRANPDELRAFVGWTAVHGPETEGWPLSADNRRLAWHLNALTARVLWSVVEGHPLAGPDRPFSPVRLLVDGEPVRMDQYWRVGIGVTYDEPLAVAAVPCGARSCPPVSRDLYRKDMLAIQLPKRMEAWVASGRLVREEAGELVFSPAFEPWLTMFERAAGAATPCAAVAPYAEDELRARLEADPACPHRWAAWDGALDGA